MFLRFSRYIHKGGWQQKIASTEARGLVHVIETGRSLSSCFIGPHKGGCSCLPPDVSLEMIVETHVLYIENWT